MVALQKADYRTKFRKCIKGAYWNYHLLINEIMEKRGKAGKGKIHYIWIQSHMSRKGRLNESHMEQDVRAGETANNKAQHTTHIPIPEGMWNIQGHPVYKNPHFRAKSLGVMRGPPSFGELRVLTRGIRFTFWGAPRVSPTTSFLGLGHTGPQNWPKGAFFYRFMKSSVFQPPKRACHER